MSQPRLTSLSFHTLIVALMALPVLVTTLAVGATDVWRWRRPAAAFGGRVAYSFADAVEHGDGLMDVYAFIRDGQDPNAPIPVRHPSLTGDRQVLVSPLLWAVAMQRNDVALMLLGLGSRPEKTADRMSACVADALGNADLAALLRHYGNALPHEGCPDALTAGAPLLALVEGGDAPSISGP